MKPQEPQRLQYGFTLLFLLMFGQLTAQLPVNKETPPAPKTIMALFAHPDDETAIGPVLAKYGATANVHIVIATDGRYGVTDHFGVSAGDSLVAIRTQEMACACEKLGVHPPHFLGAKDGLGLNGHHNFYEEVAHLKERIKEKIRELNPDVILTFGPEGDTGHPDHRMVGLLTTEILLRENWVNHIDLYYFAWTQEQTKKFPEDWGLGWTHPDLLHTKITFSPQDEETAFSSLRCHQSQYAPQELEAWIRAEKQDAANVLHFRKFALDTVRRSGF
ncbi:PIG-L deacetylase family protein [Maribacter sp. 2307ULW6-5]|uniref:PIG-L deacetylase family protein n=1 Tax=Maribacter sp. 2307ULW6-5 TaxID=3386275 RepID=UPI0039BCBE20